MWIKAPLCSRLLSHSSPRLISQYSSIMPSCSPCKSTVLLWLFWPTIFSLEGVASQPPWDRLTEAWTTTIDTCVKCLTICVSNITLILWADTTPSLFLFPLLSTSCLNQLRVNSLTFYGCIHRHNHSCNNSHPMMSDRKRITLNYKQSAGKMILCHLTCNMLLCIGRIQFSLSFSVCWTPWRRTTASTKDCLLSRGVLTPPPAHPPTSNNCNQRSKSLGVTVTGFCLFSGNKHDTIFSFLLKRGVVNYCSNN